MGRSSQEERQVGGMIVEKQATLLEDNTYIYHVGMKQCTFSVYTYVPEVCVNETGLNDSARQQNPCTYINMYICTYIYTYCRLPKIPPRLLHITFKQKWGGGICLNISLVLSGRMSSSFTERVLWEISGICVDIKS